MNKILKTAQGLLPELIEFRREIHAHPEIGFELYNTKKIITERLNSAGIEWEEFAGSIVAKVGKEDGKSILLRTEMDALPMQEESGLPFQSRIPKQAHCCGHDLNAAILLGALKLLKKDLSKGRVVGLFQAAEETGEGAKALMDNDFLQKYNLDTGISMHVNAKFPLGKLGYGKGKMFASNTSFDVVIHGKGSHGARPFEGKDPVNMVVQLYNVLNSIVAREVNVFKHNIFSIISIKTGDSYNVIPDTVTMQCSLRTYDEESRLYLEKRFRKAIDGMAAVFGVTMDYIVKNCMPSLSTTPEFVDFLLKHATEVIPKEQIATNPDIKYGSEDYAFIAQKLKQVASMSIGAGPSLTKGYQYGQHSSKVVFNEDAIAYGSALQAWWALNYCSK